MCTGVFGKRDIGRIEREFLDVLDFELSITEGDILAHHDVIMSLVAPSRRHSHYMPPVPELGYSPASPSSTEASFSPDTPSSSTLVESEELHSKSGQTLPKEAQYVHPHVSQPRHEKRTSSTFRILRSFPFPRSFGHSSSSSSSSSSASRSELQAPSQGATQQGRCQLLPSFAAPPSQVYA
jgi:hypothetical protein